jgi:D-alanyl-D-alanine carboxypeptidase
MASQTRRKKGFLVKGLIFILAFLGLYVFWTQLDITYPAATSVATMPEAAPESTIPVLVTEITDTRFLELVNSDYPISGSPVSRMHTAASAPAMTGRSAGSSAGPELQAEAQEAVREMFGAARDAKINTFYVSSGYRSYASQKKLYNEAADKSYVQPPNHSEHQTGLAADIFAEGLTTATLAKSREGRWLADNSWKYGLVLRYPKDKQNITQIAWEPWHFRYVGQPHAWYCEQKNLCLEEYIEFLKDSGGYSASYNGKTYTVLYAKPKNGTIYVPKDMTYTVSNDNTGGYIVTAWK